MSKIKVIDTSFCPKSAKYLANLTYNAFVDAGGVTVIVVPVALIWRPDMKV